MQSSKSSATSGASPRRSERASTFDAGIGPIEPPPDWRSVFKRQNSRRMNEKHVGTNGRSRYHFGSSLPFAIADVTECPSRL